MPSSDPGARRDVRLADLTTLGVGGPAAAFVRASTPADVDAVHRWCEERRTPLFVLGGGSNVVIADDGFAGCVLQIGITGTAVSEDGGDTLVTAGAGEAWDPVVADTVARGLAGLECLSGIPGSVGGTPIQNVGAYGQEVANVIEQVTVYDRTRGVEDTLPAAHCGFSYRMSRFKAADAGRFIVCGVTFRLRPGAPSVSYPDVVASLEGEGLAAPTLGDVRRIVLAIRRAKGMVVDGRDPDSRSVGSFFMNPVVSAGVRERVGAIAGERAPAFAMSDGRVKLPAAWLIERAGFRKGEGDAAVGISSKHPLAIVNRGGATARDVLRLAARIKRGVVNRFGVWLRPEPIFVGFRDDPDLEFLQRAGA